MHSQPEDTRLELLCGWRKEARHRRQLYPLLVAAVWGLGGVVLPVMSLLDVRPWVALVPLFLMAASGLALLSGIRQLRTASEGRSMFT